MYKIREYHGSKVMSLTHEDGTNSFSIGIVSPGEFEFGAISKEKYRVTSGEIEFWEEDENHWRLIREGKEFSVVDHKNFKMKANKVSSYICFYD